MTHGFVCSSINIIVSCAYTQATHVQVFFFFQAEDGIRDLTVNGVQTCALPIVRGNLNCVISSLQRLYRASGDQYTFGFEAIVEETKRQDPTRDAKDVLPALIIGEEFGYHYFQEGIQEQDDHFVVQSATVVERIMDFTSVDEDWATTIAQEQVERSRVFKVPAPTPGTSAASRTAAGTMPNFGFMQHAKLKNIAERDYSELQRVKTVGAAKSRYVLCGGLI